MVKLDVIGDLGCGGSCSGISGSFNLNLPADSIRLQIEVMYSGRM